MLSSLLRPKKNRRRVEHSPFSSQFNDRSSPTVARNGRAQARHATADFTETDVDDDITETEDGGEDNSGEEGEGDENENMEHNHEAEDDEDGDEDTPLLPIFSAAYLDALPVYNLTHAIRLIVLPKTETTLTWDQLRSPQVSQFLVKPMQQQIRSNHFSRATLYALLANCLQFQKESQANPGNAGNSRTRAMVCELIAIKLLKEYNTRELIDALSYDFFPLQGASQGSTPVLSWEQKNNSKLSAARVSTLEVAIRASAKRFIAHPLVVQQLEAIWAGTIVFHSAADSLHRPQPSRKQVQETTRVNGSSQRLLTQNTGYGTNRQTTPHKQESNQDISTRRTVTLYDPRDASLFKLSRLRVPRYRQFFSTCSLAILLVLFVAVLAQRSMEITTLEVIFWFWSAGFMLDEVVGFNEQGFSLYIMSFWNTFDVGILMMLVIYYAMRLYGIFLVDIGRREWNNWAYDVLAANAILLFPRLFSVLDHYRYFSQLLIAFRLMAVDLVAVFVLILISCSGFFVAFTMSFGNSENDAADVGYRIFQILMGFTPAAWEVWGTYNRLGQALLMIFLIICHFLVVTILITVLTNSFMAIVSNANEEHQFVFAVNTISMVKNDALFSYVAPSNIIAWLLTPCRFVLPFRNFIKRSNSVVNKWMAQDVEPTSPQEQDRSVVDRLEKRRQARKATLIRERAFRRLSGTRSVASDPADFSRTSIVDFHGNERQAELDQAICDLDHADDEGDEDGNALDRLTSTKRSHASESDKDEDSEQEDYFYTSITTKRDTPKVTSSLASSKRYPEHNIAVPKPSPPRRRQHNRQLSTNTILFNPLADNSSSASLSKTRPTTSTRHSPPRRPGTSSKHHSGANTTSNTPAVSNTGHRTPRNMLYTQIQQLQGAKPRPILPRAGTVPNFKHQDLPIPQRHAKGVRHRRSSFDMGMSDLGLDTGPAMVPSSFATQMALATGGLKGLRGESRRDGEGEAMMGRLMLARMKTLEEGFADVVKEFRGMRTAGNPSVDGGEGEGHRDKDKGKGKERVVGRSRREGLARTKSDFDVMKQVERQDQTKGQERVGDENRPPVEECLTKGGSL
ncbi:hypothetical protein BJ878DRAFT_419430 [Calycina marina]|uniref:Ion transport domain-containing protein n=1 Tax=Calycina marina TaxID=1763456 RepID=A0A9P8CG42_9HELO|nr:hypothetical protein BJ878DRAFT_419430 [Calycina marina]